MEIGKWVRVMSLVAGQYTDYKIRIREISSKGIRGDFCYKMHHSGNSELYEDGVFLWPEIKSIAILKHAPRVVKAQGAAV